MTQPTDPAGAQAGHVAVSAHDGVASVEFYHPKGNSLPATVLRRIAEAIDEVAVRDDVRVVVLRSGGTGPFCAGASFDELKAVATATEGKDFFMGFGRIILAIRRCPKPVVARVHGKAVGGGVGLVAACDYAIAVESASIRLSELAVGIGPFIIGPAITRKVGPGHFGAMAIDADWRSARYAEHVGLYARVVSDVAELDEVLGGFVRKLAASNPAALAQIKRVTWEGTDDWAELLESRAAMSGTLVTSEYTRNFIASFAQKSPR